MSPKAFVLALQVLTGDDQQVDEFVLDYGLTREDCIYELYEFHNDNDPALARYGARVIYTCHLGDALEDGDEDPDPSE